MTARLFRLLSGALLLCLFAWGSAAEERYITIASTTSTRNSGFYDFIVVGPRLDPAGIRGMTDVVLASERIAKVEAPFVSRGDDSGPHKMELGLWKETGIDIGAASGSWYREVGAGMGAALNTAAGGLLS